MAALPWHNRLGAMLIGHLSKRVGLIAAASRHAWAGMKAAAWVCDVKGVEF
jgi:hypothetical protein